MLIVDPLLPVRIDLAKIDRMLEELDEIIDEGGAGVVGAFSAFAIFKQETAIVKHLSELNRFSSTSLLQRDDTNVLGCGTSLYVDSIVGELLHNYIHVVADLLQPAHHTDNPYRSLYIPTAIEAAADGVFVGASGTGSQAGTALFHALLAVSAFHLHRRQPGQAGYGTQGRMHRIKAFEYLRRSLAVPSMQEYPHTIMSAMLSMVSVDVGLKSSARNYRRQMHALMVIAYGRWHERLLDSSGRLQQAATGDAAAGARARPLTPDETASHHLQIHEQPLALD